ncbi:MAG TPA: hypothetical protein VKG84_02010 [Candidatus Acidoferrales bacterium]|nr:hypothetical protein [Candidatus Acidoferrales bacterium]
MPQPGSDTRCTHTTADGRRCRMPRTNAHVSLCGTHLEAEHRRLRFEPGRHAHDVLGSVTDLRSATSVNHVLGNLTAMLTDNRIDYRKAVVLAYLCQLLLQTISMAEREGWDGFPPHGNLPPLIPPLPPLSCPRVRFENHDRIGIAK